MSGPEPAGSWVCSACGLAFIKDGKLPTWAARKACAEHYEKPSVYYNDIDPVCSSCWPVPDDRDASFAPKVALR